MCQLKSFLLFAVLLELLTGAIGAPKLAFKRFHCDSVEKANKLRSLVFQKMLVKNHTVFLIAGSNEVFKFKVPILTNVNGRVLLLNGPFYEARLENPLPKREFIGYHVNGSTTSEIIRVDQYIVLGELNVDDSFARSPVRKVEIEMRLAYFLNTSRFSQIFESRKTNSLVVLMMSKGSMSIFRSVNSTKLMVPDSKLLDVIALNKEVTFWLYDESEETHNKTLFWIDRKKYVHIYGSIEQPEGRLSFPIRKDLFVTDWFACPVDELARLEGRLKGIFYSDKLFFLFINHYYLKIEEDLVESKFNLQRGHLKGGKSLPTSDVDYGFENNDFKYVKTIRGGALLVLQAGEMYELSVAKKELVVRPMAGQKYRGTDFPKCLDQTLSVTNIFFCFNETSYQVMLAEEKGQEKGESHEIAGLFANMQLYPANEKLQYTFDYGQDEFVLMTLTAMYLVKYKAVRVDLKSYKLLIDDRKFVRKIEGNGLFEGPTDVSPTTTSRVTGSNAKTSPNKPTTAKTDPSHRTSEVQRTKDSSNLIVLVLLVLSAVFILLTLLFYIVNYARKQRRRDPDLLRAFIMSKSNASKPKTSRALGGLHSSKASSQFIRSAGSSIRSLRSRNSGIKK